MRRLVAFALVFVVGFGAGAAFWYLAGPLFVDRVVDEALPPSFMAEAVARGEFRDADAVHKGSGTAEVLVTGAGDAVLRLTDFSVTNGPDLEVWLVEAAGIGSSADVTASTWVSLGPLKGNIGNQTYVIPPEIEPDAYRTVVIWCEQFGVLFSAAELAAP